jgi:hypothetical protein
MSVPIHKKISIVALDEMGVQWSKWLKSLMSMSGVR